MMKNQCGSCKKLVKLADMVNNICPKCGGEFRIEEPVIEAKIEATVETQIETSNENPVNVEAEIAAVEKPKKHEVAYFTDGSVLIEPGRNGVTNMQMIPRMKELIDTNENEKLLALKEQFPAVFESSFKYLKKSYKTKCTEIAG